MLRGHTERTRREASAASRTAGRRITADRPSLRTIVDLVALGERRSRLIATHPGRCGTRTASIRALGGLARLHRLDEDRQMLGRPLRDNVAAISCGICSAPVLDLDYPGLRRGYGRNVLMTGAAPSLRMQVRREKPVQEDNYSPPPPGAGLRQERWRKGTGRPAEARRHVTMAFHGEVSFRFCDRTRQLSKRDMPHRQIPAASSSLHTTRASCENA